MLRWINRNAKEDRIWNEEICLNIEMTSIDEKKRENCPRWLVICKGKINVVKKSDLIQVEGTKRGRENDILNKEVIKRMLLDRIE